MQDQRFIIWDPRDGEPRREEDGTITSSGTVGVLTPGNVYLTTYAQYAEGTPLTVSGCPALAVGAFVAATFSLSGSKGTYLVYRVK